MRTPREIALRVLEGGVDQGFFLEDRLDDAFREGDLSSQDRALVSELTRGVTRRRRTLDWVIAGASAQGLPKSRTALEALRLGVYQLLWLDRVPDHAAVSESVELVKRCGAARLAAYVNGVLRGIQRDRATWEARLMELEAENPAVAHSHPDALFKKWSRDWGRDEAIALMRWNNHPPVVYARVRRDEPLRGSLLKAWRDAGWEGEPLRFDGIGGFDFWEIPPGLSPRQAPGFAEGRLYFQDPSAALAPSLLAPEPGQRLLDFCAAPGGKTTALAQLAGDQAQVFAYDHQGTRLRRVEENAARMGLESIRILADEAALESEVADGGGFDRILVDAPCSNTGVFRRRVDGRWRLNAKERQRLVELQSAILDRVAPWVRPGGVIVYSTCSLEPEENEGVVSAFAQRSEAFTLGMSQRMGPWTTRTDGAFVALLMRDAGNL